MRTCLPQRRAQDIVDVEVDGRAHTVAIGTYDHGAAGEVFIDGAKAGTLYQALLNDASIVLSLLIQHGVAPAVIAESMGRTEDGEHTSILGVAVDLAASVSKGQRW